MKQRPRLAYTPTDSSPPLPEPETVQVRQCRFENPSGAAVIVPRIWIIGVTPIAGASLIRPTPFKT